MMIWLALGVLAVGGMGEAVISRMHPNHAELRKSWVWPAILLALAAVMIAVPSQPVSSGELAEDRVAQGTVALLLVVSATTWRTKPPGPAYRLLATMGAILAVVANSMLTLWIGLLLWMAAANNRATTRPKTLGAILVVLATAMLYAGTGKLHIDALGDWCAASAGALRIEVYAGILSLAVGVALVSGLIGSDEHRNDGDLLPLARGLDALLVGTVILLRLGLALPSLWWEWRWLLGLLALAQAVIALDHWLRLYPEQRRWPHWLGTLQGAALLWTLAWCQSPLGFAANVAMALSLALVTIGLTQARGRRPILAGLLLGLGGLPVTLGMQARALLLQSVGWPIRDWRAWLFAASLMIPAALHAWSILALWQVDLDDEHRPASWRNATIAWLAVLALVASGIRPGPLIELARWLLG